MFRHLPLLLILAAVPTVSVALSDPTRPPGKIASVVTGKPASTSRDTSWTLSSILLAPGRATAVVNGAVVGVGDKVGEARVSNITSTTVVLRQGARDITLDLLARDIKQPVKDKGAMRNE